jgi:hypothetical protein
MALMNTSAPAGFLLPCTISRSQGYSTTTNNDLFNQKEDYDNAQVQLMVQHGDSPVWFGMDCFKRNGKAILSVEAIRSNMD